jgi:chromosomal replication initiation ATPase DnaA
MAPAIMTLRDVETIKTHVSMSKILVAVALVTGISTLEITSKCRWRPITDARQLFFYMARHYTAASTTTIAKFCHLSCHASVLHAVKKINGRLPEWRERIMAVERMLK